MADKVVHFEIPTDNLDRAQKFYADVFGWKMNKEPTLDYVLVGTSPTDAQGRPTQPGAINGGMLKRQEPIQNVVITIHVPNIDAAARKIEKAGGKVVRKKMPVGPIGFAAYFQDSEGNVVGLWQDAKP